MKKGTICAGILAAAAVAAGLGCKAKPDFPGKIYVLSQSNILAVSREAAETLVAGVNAAAMAPDGRSLLFALSDQIILRDFEAKTDKTILASSARSLGWAPDGSKFFIVTGCDSNRLLVGDPGGKTTEIFKGRKARPAPADDPGAASAEETCGEIGGCVFLDKNLLVFSAFEAAWVPPARENRLVANRGYLVRLDADPVEFATVDFPVGERWSFQDVSPESDLVLFSADKNPGGAEAFRSAAFVSPRFREWGKLSFGTELAPNVARWLSWSWEYDGETALVFTPVSHRLFGLVYEQTEAGMRGDFILIDPASGEGTPGPEMEPGRLVNRPVFSPDETFAAVLHDAGREVKISIIDLATKKRMTAWRVEAPSGGGYMDVRRDRLLAWLE